MIVNNLRYEFGTSSCVLEGKGSWTGPDEDQNIKLEIVSVGRPALVHLVPIHFLN